jgi:ClpP class serine protease
VVRARREGKLKTSQGEKTYTGADGKKFTVQETEPFNGRTFLAQEAKDLGLVDEIGYLEDAVAKAGQLARLPEPRVVQYQRRKSLLESLIGARAGAALDLRLLDEVRSVRFLMVWEAPGVELER